MASMGTQGRSHHPRQSRHVGNPLQWGMSRGLPERKAEGNPPAARGSGAGCGSGPGGQQGHGDSRDGSSCGFPRAGEIPPCLPRPNADRVPNPPTADGHPTLPPRRPHRRVPTTVAPPAPTPGPPQPPRTGVRSPQRPGCPTCANRDGCPGSPRPSTATTAVPRQRHRAGCARRPPLAARLSRRTKPPRMAAPNGASADPLPGGGLGVPGRPRCPRGVGEPRASPAPSRSGGARLWGGAPSPPAPCAGAQGHGEGQRGAGGRPCRAPTRGLDG